MAEEFRFSPGEAIIYTPYSKPNNLGISALAAKRNNDQLKKIERDSYSSLTAEKLSGSAYRVSLIRKAALNKNSVRFLKVRNPCNALVIKRLLKTSKALRCEPNWEAYISLTPNDTQYSNLFAADTTSAGRINLPGAWDLSTGSSNVVVAVIDTGIDYNHLDLQSNMWVNPGEIPSNGIDDDGNGYVDDIYGIDTYNTDTNPFDDHSHGTHVAGTIGATGNNSRGVVGVNWNVKQIGCKAFNASGFGRTSAIIECLNYVANLKSNFGINIVATNNSYGGLPYSSATYNAIAANRDAGIVFVAAAGNSANDNDNVYFYPASYNLDNIISVAATDINGNLASFSSYGITTVDIAAPGVSILSTIPGNQYAYYQGTSMASPHVAGAVALLLAYHPEYSYSQAITSILSTGTVMAGLGRKCATSAILNVEEALKYSFPVSTPTPTPTPTPNPEDPNDPPENSQPDLNTATFGISVTNLRAKTLVKCSLSVLNDDLERIALPGYDVTLLIRGVRAQRETTTNVNGDANFFIKPSRYRTYSAQCRAILTDRETNERILIKSERISIPKRR